MATTKAVGAVLAKFLEECRAVLPAKRSGKIEKVLGRLAAGEDVIRDVMEEFKGCEKGVMARDDAVFAILDTKPIFGTLKLGHYWKRFEPSTQQVIWQYTQSIFMLGTGLTQMSAEQLGKIESFATTCAEKMQALQKDGKQPDMRDVQKFMMSEMGSLFKGMDLPGMGGQAGGAQEKFDREEFVQFMRQNKGLASGVDLEGPEFKAMLDDIERMQVKSS